MRQSLAVVDVVSLEMVEEGEVARSGEVSKSRRRHLASSYASLLWILAGQKENTGAR